MKRFPFSNTRFSVFFYSGAGPAKTSPQHPQEKLHSAFPDCDYTQVSQIKQINQIFLDPMSYLDRQYSILLSSPKTVFLKTSQGFPRLVYNNYLHFQTSNSSFNPLHCAFCLCHTFEIIAINLMTFLSIIPMEIIQFCIIRLLRCLGQMDCYHLLDTLLPCLLCYGRRDEEEKKAFKTKSMKQHLGHTVG